MTPHLGYTYAVARRADPLAAALTRIDGVARAPVHLVHATRDAGLLAAVSPVSADDFGQETLRRLLETSTGRRETTRAHDRVVEAVAACTAVLPLRLRLRLRLRLATVHLDERRVRQMLDDRHDALAARTARSGT
ncbi:gas vesicle protein GvpL/GvpF [Streptomyces sp. TLI_235]|nr:GvpL/GvpF family gas vesicle protein [Streptomyces sp. TLI_235]PBC70474.1 gas vesicle protein GvpL/GvpF [Streptomyces sp. TLI_235]